MSIEKEENKYFIYFNDNNWATIRFLSKYNQWYGYYRGRRFAKGDIIYVYCTMLNYCYNSINFIPPQKEELDDDF